MQIRDTKIPSVDDAGIEDVLSLDVAQLRRLVCKMSIHPQIAGVVSRQLGCHVLQYSLQTEARR